jgi:hypothetical protein
MFPGSDVPSDAKPSRWKLDLGDVLEMTALLLVIASLVIVVAYVFGALPALAAGLFGIGAAALWVRYTWTAEETG